ncbi:MAG: hypothetical protein J6V30_01010, partial [Paludibacteraceae bacterium]|nr:hypothetical protein [Paludibacteraceae bacterium]
MQAINEEKAQAQAELDRWKKVQEEMERRANMQTQVVEQEASDNLTDNVKTDSGKGQEVGNIGRSLTKEEAQNFVAEMENSAEVAPEVDLNIENWDALFGENGIINTPIGDVKMGENQFAKLMRQGREGKLGMIKPTLENPHAIIEEASEAKEGDTTERASSYIFVRSFKKADGSRFYYFTSITVSKDGREVVVSSQEKSRNKILRLLEEGSVIWHTPKDVTTSSAERQGLDYEQSNKAETATKGSGITPQSTSSLDKDRNSVSNSQENTQKSGEIAENGGEIQEPTYTEETLENGDNDASPNSVNQDKRFSVKGEKKKDIRRAREIVDKMLPPITGEGLGFLEGETYMEYVAKLFGGKKGIRITPESFHKEIGGGLAEKRKLFGILAGKDKGGMSIEGASEFIFENYYQELLAHGFKGDQIDVRNLIVEILGYGNPLSYARRVKEERLQRYIGYEEFYADEWAREQHFDSYDDMRAYYEQYWIDVIEKDRNFDEEEYNSILADEYYQEQNNKNYDTTRESRSEGNGSEVLHRERPQSKNEKFYDGSEVLQGTQSLSSTSPENVGAGDEGGEVSSDVLFSNAMAVAQSESGEKGEIDLSNKHWVVRLTEEEKREEIAQLSEELGVEIHAIQDVSELPETEKRAKEAIEKGGGGVRAWINVNSGEVYVYMPNVETATLLRESVMHEVVGHKGLSELYKGDEKGYETKIKEIWDMMRPEDKSYFLDYALRYNLNVSPQKIASIYMSAGEIGLEESLKRHGVDVDRVKTDAAEEYVAHLAEWGLWNAFAFEGKDKSVWRKMVDFVLDKVFKFNAPEVAVAKLLYNSRHNYEKMKRNLDPLVTAEESVNKEKVNKFADNKIEDERRRFSVSRDIENMFDRAVSGDMTGKPKSIGKLTKEGKEYLESISGIELKDDVDFVLNPSDLVHIYNNHYGENEKDKGNNMPLTRHDIGRMVDVISFPTKVIYGEEPKSKRKLFYFLMDSSNGSYNLLEIYADRKGNLTTKTYYKTKKDATQRVMELKSLLPTSETYSGAILSDAKIPQMFEISKQEEITPKNTTIDDVLRYSIKVNHNSPYLLKRADGSFVDPETGERLGFDHRFMGKGEGAQVHGYGSYFSVNDLRHYGDIRRKQIRKVKFGTSKWYEFGQSSSEDSEGNVAMHVMGEINSYGNSDKALAYNKRRLEYNEHQLNLAGIAKGYHLRKATDATEVKEITERYDEQIARLENEIKITEKVISFLEQLPYTTPSKIKYKQEQDSAHHYEVEIPDNTGSNYLEEDKPLTSKQITMLKEQNDKEHAGLGGLLSYAKEKNEQGSEEYTFRKFYSDLSSPLGANMSSKASSEFLSRAGFVGIHYYGGRDGECYVIFNENDAKIVDHTRFSVKE